MWLNAIPFVEKTRILCCPSDISNSINSFFELQEQGYWEEADKIIEQLEQEDDRLLGHVRFQRYMHSTAYHARFEELVSWLKQYSEHPGAIQIYRLALSLRPQDAPPPPIPPYKNSTSVKNLEIVSLVTIEEGYIFPQAPDLTQNEHYLTIKEQIKETLQLHNRRKALQVFHALTSKYPLSDLEYDALRSFLASEFYYQGYFRLAYTLAEASIQRNGPALPEAYKIAGFVSWYRQQFSEAQAFFTKMAEYAFTPKQFSQAYFWAGRSFLKLKDQENAIRSFEQASRAPRTFYGLLSLYFLKKDHNFYWKFPALAMEDIRKLSQNPAGRRAIALLQIQQYDLAEDELLHISLQKYPELIETLISLAIQERLPSLALQLGNTYTPQTHKTYDAALYPLAHWQPYNAYTVDHALMYAFIRHESRFNMRAR